MTTGSATVTLRTDAKIGRIHPNLYGHFAEHLGRCVYEGLWVGEDSAIGHIRGIRQDTIGLLRELRAPVIRWPGGCFADDYHWEDGIGPRDQRPRRLNLWWPAEESNHFGTHEFIDACRQVGAEPYICLNVGSGSPREARDWIEYCNADGNTTLANRRRANGHSQSFRVRYFGVGNENWGCGGQFDPVDYAKEYRRYACFLRAVGQDVQLIACGHTTPDWNYRFLEAAEGASIDHLSIHRYYGAGPSTGFSEADHYQLIARAHQVEPDIDQTAAALRLLRPGSRIGIILDEWGVWHPEARADSGLEQANTLRDAVSAATVLNILNQRANAVTMANIAQTVNVLQCVVQTDGAACWPTPTYHVFHMFRPHMGAGSFAVEVEGPVVEYAADDGRRPSMPAIHASASAGADDGMLCVTLVNRHLTEDLECRIVVPAGVVAEASAIQLAGATADAHNTADAPGTVQPVEVAAQAMAHETIVRLAKCSVTAVQLRLG